MSGDIDDERGFSSSSVVLQSKAILTEPKEQEINDVDTEGYSRIGQ
jgi:hypothetical protein